MKQVFIILSFITTYSYPMELIPSLRDDAAELVIQYALPKLNLYDQYAHKQGIFPDNSATKDQKDTNNALYNLQQIVSVIQTFRLTSKHWEGCMTKNAASWLGISQDNANALIIRATQAHIPYFMKLAIAHKADLNFVHKPSGHTPLSYATTHNQYNTCKFLLENGASVNIKREAPYATYSYDSGEWPIHTAIKNNTLKLVQLFIKYHAQLEFQFFLTDPLLTVAAKQNNPYILAILLQARPHTNSYNHWSSDEIEHALETVKQLEIKTDKEKLEKITCINILQEAQKIK